MGIEAFDLFGRSLEPANDATGFPAVVSPRNGGFDWYRAACGLFEFVRVTGGELPNRPGVILDIVEPLSEAGINIHDAITSATSVAIFVAWDDREETLGIIQDEF